jgi:hypothetical protein
MIVAPLLPPIQEMVHSRVTSLPGIGIDASLALTCPSVSLLKDKAKRRIHCFPILLMFYREH